MSKSGEETVSVVTDHPSVPSTATAVCEPLCGSTPIITTINPPLVVAM